MLLKTLCQFSSTCSTCHAINQDFVITDFIKKVFQNIKLGKLFFNSKKDVF